MAEIIFVLTTLYAAYVIRKVVMNDQRKEKEADNNSKSHLTNTKGDKKTSETKKKSIPKKGKSAKNKLKLLEDNIRNPETGEVTKIAGNYQMTKRWIKEALVAEGLLEKIYKTKEMDEVAKIKISKALDKLKAMDKYQ